MTLSGGGGVRPTTVLCDWAATTGAELHDRAWLTEREGHCCEPRVLLAAGLGVSGKGAVLPQWRDAGRERGAHACFLDGGWCCRVGV